MKVVAFFSRLAIICNIAFLLFILFGQMEARKPVIQKPGIIIPVSYFKDIVITLGISAIIINLIMCIVYSILVIIGKQRLIPKRLAVINMVFFIFQIFYFFFR